MDAPSATSANWIVKQKLKKIRRKDGYIDKNYKDWRFIKYSSWANAEINNNALSMK